MDCGRLIRGQAAPELMAKHLSSALLNSFEQNSVTVTWKLSIIADETHSFSLLLALNMDRSVWEVIADGISACIFPVAKQLYKLQEYEYQLLVMTSEHFLF